MGKTPVTQYLEQATKGPNDALTRKDHLDLLSTKEPRISASQII